MKILCFIDSLGSGGAQRQLVELACGFKEKGHDVHFLIYHNITFFEKKLLQNNIPIKIISEKNYLKRLLKIRKEIRTGNPDLLVSFLQSANFIATISGFPFKKWQLIVGERSANPNIFKSPKLRMFRFFHVFADYVVANSYTNINIVKTINPFLKPKKLKVIYNIVSTPNDFERKHETNDKTIITVAASYNPEKNLLRTIEAISLLNPEIKKKFEIHWFGKMDKNNFILNEGKKLIQHHSLNEVIKLNQVTHDIFSIYDKSDFVALFSLYEGFPNTICEAMFIGKPVIVSKVSDIEDLLVDQKNGFLCESNDVNSIKNAIINAIDSTNDERENMGRNNLKIANELFDKEVIVNQYLSLIKNK